MTQFYECFDCRKIAPLAAAEPSCALCGSKNGQALTAAELKQGFDAGAYFNIDPTTGKRAKTRRR